MAYVLAGAAILAITVSLAIIFATTPQLVASQKPYTKITILDVRDTYKVNEPVGFSATVQGFGISCDTLIARIEQQGEPDYPGIQWTEFHRCSSEAMPSNFSFAFSTDTTKVNATLNQTGTYILTVAFRDGLERIHSYRISKQQQITSA